MTAPDYQLVGNRQYPEIVQDFQSSFAVLRVLACDVFLAGHSWEFGLETKREALRAGAVRNPFINPEDYRIWLEKSARAFRNQLEAQSRH